jgi:hypothetical protein
MLQSTLRIITPAATAAGCFDRQGVDAVLLRVGPRIRFTDGSVIRTEGSEIEADGRPLSHLDCNERIARTGNSREAKYGSRRVCR